MPILHAFADRVDLDTCPVCSEDVDAAALARGDCPVCSKVPPARDPWPSDAPRREDEAGWNDADLDVLDDITDGEDGEEGEDGPEG